MAVLDLLDESISVDALNMTVTVSAGTRYGTLAAELNRQGFALHNMASLPHISVAGAVATATHGSGDANGNLATAVAGLEMVTADGGTFSARRGDAYFEGMEHTAVRASLIACNDVDIALQVMKLPDPQSPPQPKNRVRELVLFLISEQYAELRGRLGLALKG